MSYTTGTGLNRVDLVSSSSNTVDLTIIYSNLSTLSNSDNFLTLIDSNLRYGISNISVSFSNYCSISQNNSDNLNLNNGLSNLSIFSSNLVTTTQKNADFTNINISLSNLQNKDVLIDSYLATLDDTDTAIQSDIGLLQLKDIEIDESIEIINDSIINLSITTSNFVTNIQKNADFANVNISLSNNNVAITNLTNKEIIDVLNLNQGISNLSITSSNFVTITQKNADFNNVNVSLSNLDDEVNALSGLSSNYVTLSGTQTLVGKTIDYSLNTILNLPSSGGGGTGNVSTGGANTINYIPTWTSSSGSNLNNGLDPSTFLYLADGNIINTGISNNITNLTNLTNKEINDVLNLNQSISNLSITSSNFVTTIQKNADFANVNTSLSNNITNISTNTTNLTNLTNKEINDVLNLNQSISNLSITSSNYVTTIQKNADFANVNTSLSNNITNISTNTTNISTNTTNLTNLTNKEINNVLNLNQGISNLSITSSNYVTLSGTQTLVGKTIDYSLNTILNLPSSGGGSGSTSNYYLNDQPIGAIIDYVGTSAPTSWLMCYGQAISRSTYADLFTIIGTAYGIGDGSTTFNLPDLRGRVTAGKDNMGGSSADRLTNLSGGLDGDILAATGGSESHTLTIAQMPSHTHNTQTSASGFGNNTGPNSGTLNVPTSSTGGDGAHNNVQPTIIVNKIIKYTFSTTAVTVYNYSSIAPGTVSTGSTNTINYIPTWSSTNGSNLNNGIDPSTLTTLTGTQTLTGKTIDYNLNTILNLPSGGGGGGGGGTGNVSTGTTNTINYIPTWTSTNGSNLNNGIDPTTLVTLTDTQTLTNKTLQSITNNIVANKLYAGISNVITINNSLIPVQTNAILTAISATEAMWKQPSNTSTVPFTPTINNISNPYRVRAFSTVGQTISTATYTKVSYNSETYDTNNNFNNATYRYTASVAGFYHIDAQLAYSNVTINKLYYLCIYKNGVMVSNSINQSGNAIDFIGITISDCIQLDVNDYIEIFTYQNSGANNTTYVDSAHCNLNILLIAVTTPSAISAPVSSGNIVFTPTILNILNNYKARAYLNTTQTGAVTGAFTKVNMSSESYDTNNEYNTTLYRYVVTSAGFYHIDAQITFTNIVANKRYYVSIYKNNVALNYAVNQSGGDTNFITVNSSDMYQLAVNDYIEMFAHHQAGINVDILGDSSGIYSYLTIYMTACTTPVAITASVV